MNEIEEAVAPLSPVLEDTAKFFLDTHEFHVQPFGVSGKGGWSLVDFSTTGEPTTHKQPAFLASAVSPIQFATVRVDTSTVQIYEMNESNLLGAWNISTAAPLYPAETLTLSDTAVSMLVGDTVVITATVTPDNCTSDMSWRIDKTRAFSLKRDGYSVRLIAKSLCDAELTCTIDNLKKVVPVYVVKEKTGVEDIIHKAYSSEKLVRDGQLVIKTGEGEYSVTGSPL